MKYLKFQSCPEKLRGEVLLPSSKSISNRVLMIRELSAKDFNISNLSAADDTILMQKLLKQDSRILTTANAGTVLRFLTAFFAQSDQNKILTGSSRMKNRPVKPLVDALLQMGAEIRYLEKEAFPPVEIQGRQLKGGNLKVDASISSQFVSALLMLAPVLNEGLTIELKGPVVSYDYIRMTLKLMSYFGVDFSESGNHISIPRQDYQISDYQVENDWSSASFLFGLAATFEDSDLYLPGFYKNSIQGDAILPELMARLGVECIFSEEGIRLQKKHAAVKQLTATMNACPDLVPALAFSCAYRKIPFHLKDIGHLRYKESDRLEVIAGILNQLGAEIVIQGKDLICTAYKKMKYHDMLLDTHDDHRIAMAAFIFSYDKDILISHPDCVKKSFPEYWRSLDRLGFTFEQVLYKK